jgi:segregation and condensation protein A
LGAAYPVTLPVFEGPLDLLLHLIEQEKLDISEVSLVAVTDQYLRSMEQMEELTPGALADFLVVASRLLYIKSARLLPKPPQNEDAEESDADTLVRHLLEYRQIKRAATTLREREEAGERLFVRPPVAVDVVELTQKPLDFGDVNAEMLQKALRRALSRIPVTPPPPTVQLYTVTVAEQIEVVRMVVEEARRTQPDRPALKFSMLLGMSKSRLEIIVTFLAVLELVKQRELVAEQHATFGEIVLLPAKPAVESAAEELVEGDESASAADPEQGPTEESRAGDTD